MPVANATLGLIVATSALRRRARRTATEVLVPSFAFPAPVQAAIWNSLLPVFVDVADDHWHLDPVALEAALSARGDRVALVIALSSFGTPPPPTVRNQWETICRDHGVPLLVDSAAGFGAQAADGRAVGAQGDVEVVSFHATKPLAAGEGGAVFTRDPDLATEIGRRANFGFDDRREVAYAQGLNAKLSEPAAAIALAALDALGGALATRRRLAATLLGALEDEVHPQLGSELGTWQFVSVLASDSDHRDAVLDRASERVELRSYYRPLHRSRAFRDCETEGSLRRTETLGDRILSLPMAVDLTPRELEAIEVAVREARSVLARMSG